MHGSIDLSKDEAFVADARDVLGSEFVLTGEDAQLYASGARYGSGVALCVLRPASTQEVSTLVGLAVKNDITLVLQAANTGLVGGSTPDGSGMQAVLSVDRLRGDLRVDPIDRSVRVSAGYRLSELNNALDEHGLFFPIDLGADPMIGGMVATNTGGARFIRYGDVRQRVQEVEVVLFDAEGTIIKLGAQSRKSSETLALKDLMVGSCGTLGVVTSARLEPANRPTSTANVLIVPRDLDSVDHLLVQLEKLSGPTLSAFEFMSGTSISIAFNHVPSLSNPFSQAIPDFALLVEFSAYGTDPTLAERDLESTLIALYEDPTEAIADAIIGKSDDFWRLRHSITDGAKNAGEVIAFDLGFPRSQVLPFRSAAISALQAALPQLSVCDFGHLGDGGLHFNCVWPKDAPPLSPEQKAKIRDLVFDIAVNQFNGSFSSEHGLGQSNQAAYNRYIPERIKQISKQVTRSFASHPMGNVKFGQASNRGQDHAG